MGEAKRKVLAARGALLVAHEAFHEGNVDRLHQELHFLLGLGDLEADGEPLKVRAGGEAQPAIDPVKAFGAAFRALCREFDIRGCAVVVREALVDAGGIDPVTKLITPRRKVKQVSFQAHGDQAVIAELQKRLRGGADV